MSAEGGSNLLVIDRPLTTENTLTTRTVYLKVSESRQSLYRFSNQHNSGVHADLLRDWGATSCEDSSVACEGGKLRSVTFGPREAQKKILFITHWNDTKDGHGTITVRTVNTRQVPVLDGNGDPTGDTTTERIPTQHAPELTAPRTVSFRGDDDEQYLRTESNLTGRFTGAPAGHQGIGSSFTMWLRFAPSLKHVSAGATVDHGSGGTVPLRRSKTLPVCEPFPVTGRVGGIHTVELYRKVRLACRDGMSERAAARHFGVSRQSVRKMLQFSVPPGYRRTAPVRRPKLDEFTGLIEQWLEDDSRHGHRKQRPTAKRIFERLRDEHGFTGGYTIVKDYVREHRRHRREMFVPLTHPPGHAQADFGEAWAVIAGVKQQGGTDSCTNPSVSEKLGAE